MAISPSSKRILIACGGTGGHLAPGIALAQKLTSRGHQCELLISSKQVDQRLIQKYPALTFRALPAVAPGKTFSHITPKSFLNFLWAQLSSLGFCAKTIHHFRPHAVVGFGGFITISAAMSAWLHRVPLFLHEGNHKPGRTIRVLKGLARVIYLPPGISKHGIPAHKVVELGLPLREDLKAVSREEARKALGLPLRGRLVVVLGGSQGATPLNRWASDNLETLLGNGIHLYCVTGPQKEETRAVEHQMPLGQIAKAVFVPFSDKMHLLYSAADLVVTRAGAGTIAELVKLCVPSILVPYPFAADDHQRANAANLERKGAAVVVDESNIDNLLNEVLYTLKSDTMLDSLRANLTKIDMGDPALTMAEAIEKLSRKTRGEKSDDKNPEVMGHTGTLEETFTAAVKHAKISTDAIKLAFNEPLGPKTTFGIGGPARVWAEPTNEKDLAALLKIARQLKLPVFILGRGSNLLVLDKGFDGLVLRQSHPNWQRIEFLKNKTLRAWAGARLKALCAEACRMGLEGFEFMEGIPATVGGALRMNAGAFGGWLFDRVERVCYMTPDGRLHQRNARDLKPAYRSVPGLKDAIILWATLIPAKSTSENTPVDIIRQTLDGYQTKRKASQPREPSAGCVFKNPSKELSAGMAIDQAGLKGLSVGQASVSTVHANFIVNTGAATASDVIALINQIRQKIWNERKISLEPEIMLLGGDWKDYLSKVESVEPKAETK